MDLIFNNHYLLKKTIQITSTSQQNTYVRNIYMVIKAKMHANTYIDF